MSCSVILVPSAGLKRGAWSVGSQNTQPRLAGRDGPGSLPCAQYSSSGRSRAVLPPGNSSSGNSSIGLAGFVDP